MVLNLQAPLEDVANYSVKKIPNNASNVFIPIPKQVFSTAYSIPNYTRVTGVLNNLLKRNSFLSGSGVIYTYLGSNILDEQELQKISESLQYAPLEFIFVKLPIGLYDRLYLSESTWNLFRNYGLLPGDISIIITIQSVTTPDRIETLFPLRDVQFVIN